jgi:hypothetical protein
MNAEHQEYLESELWRCIIRPRVIERDRHQCLLCGWRQCLQVHHRSYCESVMAGVADHKLVTLCEGCHRQIEFDGGWVSPYSKRTYWEVDPYLVERMKQTREIIGGYREVQWWADRLDGMITLDMGTANLDESMRAAESWRFKNSDEMSRLEWLAYWKVAARRL